MLMEAHLARILLQVPGWDITQATVTPLLGGITNQNYRVDLPSGTFVVRIGGPGTRLLGIDRRHEQQCTAIAASLGVGAEVVHFLPDEEVLVTRFLPGKTLTAAEAGDASRLPRITAAMQRYHRGPAFPGAFSPFATVRSYHHLALERGVTFPGMLPHVLSLMDRIESALLPVAQIVPCHNDLLAANFLEDDQTIYILDWEYAGMGDLFFDLGNYAVNQMLEEPRCELLLREYFGEVRPNDLCHLHLMRLASDLREAFWGFLQVGVSSLDFDYRVYGQHHLDRFLSNVKTLPFERWLTGVKS
jgi:thiamine kinase-like enzyme